jgi:hypothetical protein
MPLSVSAPFRLCSFPFMPLSGLMEIVDYAGFLYANFQRPPDAKSALDFCLLLVLRIRPNLSKTIDKVSRKVSFVTA